MDLLPLAEQHRLRASEGWMELGAYDEANAELDGIEPAWRGHREVLHLRWQICRKTKNWDRCFELAKALTESAADDPRAWTSLAQTLYFTGKIPEAYDVAVSKITKFPTHWPLYYDAACYACLTGRLPQARQFLQLASALGNADEVQALAAEDPDLAALRKAG